MSEKPDPDTEEKSASWQSLDDVTISRLIELAQKHLLLSVVKVLSLISSVMIQVATILLMYYFETIVAVPTIVIKTPSGAEIPIKITWVIMVSAFAIMINRLLRLNTAEWPEIVYKGIFSKPGGRDGKDEEDK